jgi:DNA-binding NarL/FixJ family response regulator
VADDQRVVREGLGTVLRLLAEVEVVGAAADGNETLAMAIDSRKSPCLCVSWPFPKA